MASPQIENGFTRLANELLEVIIASPFSGQDFRILFTIIRRTYGWNKGEDYISLSQFAQATGLQVKRCSQLISGLTANKVILVIDHRGLRGTKKYSINADYEQWVCRKQPPSQKNETVREMARHFQKTERLRSQKSESTIERLKKDSKEKGIASYDILGRTFNN